jgi:hypothetical protein
MMAGAKAPFDSPDWIFEIKLDGYRAITSSIPPQASPSAKRLDRGSPKSYVAARH